ncbi:MAG: LysR family transcriptional regulator [Pseudomonadota bacterium]
MFELVIQFFYTQLMNAARRLDFDGLRAFLAIAREASVHGAANRVARSPAAVSMQLKKLEETLGEAVFERSKSGMRLTPAGDRLLPYAQRIIDLEDEARRAFTEDSTDGPVRVGFVEGVGDRRFPAIFDAFSRAHPGATLTMQLSTSAKLAAALDAGELDLAVFATGAVVAPRVDDEPLIEEPLVWLERPGADLWRRKPTPIAIASNACVWRKWALDSLAQSGVEYRIALESDTTSALFAAVDAGLVVAALPISTAPPRYRSTPPGGVAEAGSYRYRAVLRIAALAPPQALALADFIRTAFTEDRLAA